MNVILLFPVPYFALVKWIPYYTIYPIFQLIYYAEANARCNRKLNKADLIISLIEVNKGNTVKKLNPQTRGCSYMIKKSVSHNCCSTP